MKHLHCTALASLALAFVAPATAAPWSKAYVVEWIEPAMYYGGKGELARIDGGSDCPRGVNPQPDWNTLLVTPYRTKEEVAKLLDPEAAGKGGPSKYAAYPVRGPNKENVYDKPWSVKDPGFIEVEGKVSYGFDLDGNPNTGFTSPEGVRGVDNAFYKTSGCVKRFRAEYRTAGTAQYQNEAMHDGDFTIVMVLSGDGDPANDAHAKLAFYTSKDKMARQADNKVASGYTFRVDGDERFQSVIDVAVVNGVIQTKAPSTIVLRDFWGDRGNTDIMRLTFEKAQLRFDASADGGVTGFIGGYTDWLRHYKVSAGNGAHTQGAIHENLGWFQLPAWWYALKRNADGPPDPVTGERTSISTAYRINAIPAHIATPDGQAVITVAHIVGKNGH